MKLPILHARDPHEHHRAATPLELLFDLVSVLAIATITAQLHHAISSGHGAEAFPRFAFLFMAIWWVWMNFTWFASAFDNDGPVYRVLVMLIMGGELIFAGGAEYIFETLDFKWGLLGWIIMRIGMISLWLQASGNPEYRQTARRYAIGIAIAQLCWVIMYFVTRGDPVLFFSIGAVVFIIELMVPAIAERARQTPFHRHHMIERYGLLTIISLGEIILAISFGFRALFGEETLFAPALTATAALIVVFACFWIYFTDEDHMPDSNYGTALGWGYGHVIVFGALAVIGAAVAAEVDFAAHNSHGSTQASIAWWLGAPLAAFWLTLTFIRDRHFDLGHRAYALPVMSGIAVLAAWVGAPTLVFAVISVLAVWWRVPMQLR